MRAVYVALVLLSSMASAQAQKLVASGRPLLVYQAYSTNPDCTSAGAVVARVTESPEHGRATIRNGGVFPMFAESNVRSVCNRRRVPGIVVTYVSQRGYVGPDFVELEVLYPNGRGVRIRQAIRVM